MYYFNIPVSIFTYCAFLPFRYASVGRLSRCNKGALKWKRVASGCLFFFKFKVVLSSMKSSSSTTMARRHVMLYKENRAILLQMKG